MRTVFRGTVVPGAIAIAGLIAGACKGTTDPEPVASIQVTPSADTLVSINETLQLSATARDAAGGTISGVAITWTSLSPGVASVSTAGLVTAVSNGAADIQAASGGISVTATVTVQQVATQLGFSVVSGGATRTTIAPAIEVEIQDALGSLVATASADVTLAMGDNPGSLIMHASGFTPGNRILELVDHVTPIVVTELSNSQGTDELLGLTYDPVTDLVYATDRDNTLSTIDPVTGTMTSTAVGNAAIYAKGLTFELGGAGRLLAARTSTGLNDVYELDPANGASTLIGSVTIAGDVISGFTGLATDPTTGTIFGAVKLTGNATNKDRNLITLDVGALVATNVAALSENGVSDLTFLPDGTLLAVTGDGATNPEELWSVDIVTGVMTSVFALGNGSDGEAIAAIPARLSGTLTMATVGGVATFTDLGISAPANGYTLTASAAGLSSGTSAALNITP